MPRPGGHDQQWSRGGMLVHVPVDIHAGSVTILTSVLDVLIVQAGRRDYPAHCVDDVFSGTATLPVDEVEALLTDAGWRRDE
jgi:hypothetical protein